MKKLLLTIITIIILILTSIVVHASYIDDTTITVPSFSFTNGTITYNLSAYQIIANNFTGSISCSNIYGADPDFCNDATGASSFDDSGITENITTLNTTILNLPWSNLQSYPSTCTASQYISSLGDTLSCAAISIEWTQVANLKNNTIIRSTNTSWITNNEKNPTNATITITESQISDLQSYLTKAVQNNTNVAFIDINISNSVTIGGNINVTGKINCESIDGGTDTDFCVDATGSSSFDDSGITANITLLNSSVTSLNATIESFDWSRVNNLRNGSIVRDVNISWVTLNEDNPTNASILITESQISDLVHTTTDGVDANVTTLQGNATSFNNRMISINGSFLSKAIQNNTNVAFVDVNVSSGLSVGGNINVTGKINCENIDGGTDADFCVDANTGSGVQNNTDAVLNSMNASTVRVGTASTPDAAVLAVSGSGTAPILTLREDTIGPDTVVHMYNGDIGASWYQGIDGTTGAYFWNYNNIAYEGSEMILYSNGNVTFGGSISCASISGGSDGDFCEDAVGSGGAGLWIDAGDYIVPNESYSDNVKVFGTATLNETVITTMDVNGNATFTNAGGTSNVVQINSYEDDAVTLDVYNSASGWTAATFRLINDMNVRILDYNRGAALWINGSSFDAAELHGEVSINSGSLTINTGDLNISGGNINCNLIDGGTDADFCSDTDTDTLFSDAGITGNITLLNSSVTSLNTTLENLENSALTKAVQNNTNVAFVDVNVTNGLTVGGNINVTGTINCENIDGGTDADFCTDTSSGGAVQNNTDVIFNEVNTTNNLTVGENSQLRLATNLKNILSEGHRSDVIKIRWTDNEAKPTIAFANSSGDDKAWLVAHEYLNYPAEPHQHFSIETSNSTGQLQTRMEFPFDCDDCDIKTSNSNFTVGGSGHLNLASGDFWMRSADSNIIHQEELDLFAQAQTTIGLRVNSDGSSVKLQGLGTSYIEFLDNINVTGDINLSGNINCANIDGGTDADFCVDASSSFDDSGITANITKLFLNDSAIFTNLSQLNVRLITINASQISSAVQNNTNVAFVDVNITSGLSVGGNINGSFKISCDHIDGGTDTDFCVDLDTDTLFSDAGIVTNITLLNSSVVSLNTTLENLESSALTKALQNSTDVVLATVNITGGLYLESGSFNISSASSRHCFSNSTCALICVSGSTSFAVCD